MNTDGGKINAQRSRWLLAVMLWGSWILSGCNSRTDPPTVETVAPPQPATTESTKASYPGPNQELGQSPDGKWRVYLKTNPIDGGTENSVSLISLLGDRSYELYSSIRERGGFPGYDYRVLGWLGNGRRVLVAEEVSPDGCSESSSMISFVDFDLEREEVVHVEASISSLPTVNNEADKFIYSYKIEDHEGVSSQHSRIVGLDSSSEIELPMDGAESFGRGEWSPDGMKFSLEVWYSLCGPEPEMALLLVDENRQSSRWLTPRQSDLFKASWVDNEHVEISPRGVDDEGGSTILEVGNEGQG